jgi:chemotaxis protein histidine kinase CheA
MPNDAKHEATVFYADNRFERMARRQGGVAREQALENAQAHIEELKSDFVQWLDQEMLDLQNALSQLEGHPGDKPYLERAYQSCAHLHDVGATMGFELVTFIANNLCEILDAMKAGAPYDKDAIDCHMDALMLAKTDSYRHVRPDQVPEMTSGLRRVGELVSIVPADNTK